MKAPHAPGHSIKWYGVVYWNGETIRGPRTRSMRGGDWGWDVECSCGWHTTTGGAIQERIREEIYWHKWEAEHGFFEPEEGNTMNENTSESRYGGKPYDEVVVEFDDAHDVAAVRHRTSRGATIMITLPDGGTTQAGGKRAERASVVIVVKPQRRDGKHAAWKLLGCRADAAAGRAEAAKLSTATTMRTNGVEIPVVPMPALAIDVTEHEAS